MTRHQLFLANYLLLFKNDKFVFLLSSYSYRIILLIIRRFSDMRYLLLFLFMIISFTGFSQSKEINIDWEGYRVFSTSSAQFEIPYFKNYNFNFTPSKGVSLTAQWNENTEIDQNSIVIESVIF